MDATKVRKGERSFGCDVGVNSAAEAYVLHGRQRILTACRFSEFIMNVLLFASFSITFLFSFTPFYLTPPLLPFFLSPPSYLPIPFLRCSPSLSQTHVAYHPESKNKDLYERCLVASLLSPAVTAA